MEPIRLSVASSALAVILASCLPVSGDPPSASPTIAPASTELVASAALPPGDIGLGRFVDSRDFSVTFVAWSSDGEETARQLASALPDAWSQATGGRGRVKVRAGEADIHILVLNTPGLSTGGGRGITLRIPGTRVGNTEIRVMLHEIAHSLGCCFGEGANAGGHWLACDPTGEVMCQGGPRTGRFSDRELRALRLLDPSADWPEDRSDGYSVEIVWSTTSPAGLITRNVSGASSRAMTSAAASA